MENTKLYYEFARERLRSQETLNAEHDTKVNHTVTLGVAVVSIGALLINLSGNALSGNLWASVPTALFVLSFAAMVGCSVMGRRLSNWHNGPLEERFAEYAKKIDSDILQQWVNDSYSKTLRCNDATLLRKARWVEFVQYGLYLEVAAFIAVGVTCCWS